MEIKFSSGSENQSHLTVSSSSDVGHQRCHPVLSVAKPRPEQGCAGTAFLKESSQLLTDSWAYIYSQLSSREEKAN